MTKLLTYLLTPVRYIIHKINRLRVTGVADGAKFQSSDTVVVVDAADSLV